MSINFSDELINAYVDGELNGSEKEAFKKAMAEDKSLADKVNSLYELKQFVQSSYAHVSESENYSHTNSSTKYKKLLKFSSAAGVFLLIGASFGWLSHQYLNNSPAVTTSPLNGFKLSPVNMQQSSKIILHVENSKHETLKLTLDKIEAILNQYQITKQPFELEVIANAGGIDLLRKDVSPYEKKIESIIKTNQNVSFIACSNTLHRLKMQGIETKLIADTKIGPTALEQIVKRLQQGWIYIKV